MPIITNLGEYLITQQQQAGQPLIIDKMILAYVPGLDSNSIPSRDQVMPTDVKISKPITKDGLLNSNVVVYSTVFPSTDGTFDFNWMGLYSSAHDVIVAVAYVPLQTKIKTVGTDVGNVITKNFAIEFTAAANITGINISAESWQIDYTARLMSMDKHQCDLVKNIYGESTFLNDAFKVKYSVDKYYLTAGKAILGGINFDLETDLEIVPGALPQTVWIDVYQETSMMGVLNKFDVVFNDGTVKPDYAAGSVEHTLVKLGVINSTVDIVDGRSVIKKSLELKVTKDEIDNITELRSTEPEYSGQKVILLGRNQPGGGGYGIFFSIFNDTDIDDDGIKFKTPGGHSWNRLDNKPVQPSWYGLNTLDELQEVLKDDGKNIVHAQYGRLSLRNGKDDDRGILDIPNFAGQESGTSAPTGIVSHHYTDGTQMQMDNVGEGTTLTLKLAHNDYRRSDKPVNYVGQGKFISFNRANATSFINESLGYISKTFEFVWSGVGGMAKLWQNKADDGVAAFRFQTTNKHAIIVDFFNGLANTVFRFKSDVNYTRAVIETDSTQTNGLMVNVKAGGFALYAPGDFSLGSNKLTTTSGKTLTLSSDTGPVTVQTPLKLRSYSTSALPDAAGFIGCVVSITDNNGKPSPLVFSNGTNWIYMDNTLV